MLNSLGNDYYNHKVFHITELINFKDMKRSIIIVIIAIIGVLVFVYGPKLLKQPSDSEPKVETIENHKAHEGHGDQQADKPFFQGEIVSFEHGGGYTFIEVKEETNITFWIAVEKADVKKGDFIKFQKELVMHNFKSKSLNRTFDEIMFASNLHYKIPE